MGGHGGEIGTACILLGSPSAVPNWTSNVLSYRAHLCLGGDMAIWNRADQQPNRRPSMSSTTRTRLFEIARPLPSNGSSNGCR